MKLCAWNCVRRNGARQTSAAVSWQSLLEEFASKVQKFKFGTCKWFDSRNLEQSASFCGAVHTGNAASARMMLDYRKNEIMKNYTLFLFHLKKTDFKTAFVNWEHPASIFFCSARIFSSCSRSCLSRKSTRLSSFTLEDSLNTAFETCVASFGTGSFENDCVSVLDEIC